MFHRGTGWLCLLGLLPLLQARAGDDADLEAGDQAVVKVLDQHLFSQPLFYSAPVAELSLGEVLGISAESGDWFEARTGAGISGWVHSTAITETGVDLAHTGGGSGSVSAEEITLSGRGFNADIEASYRDENPDLDFTPVDQMERMEVEPGELYQFLLDGNLLEGEVE
ncbi:hypothetical protein JW921_11500 [Candidatus Fermentibacterales bacterium]|nr:hypothetical protein [Candidatus Fermentibacterales bacterium]